MKYFMIVHGESQAEDQGFVSQTFLSTNVIVDINGTEDYISIQDAINNASCGDTILIKGGIYNEDIYINKSITLDNYQNPPTIISNSFETLKIINTEKVRIRNLTIINNNDQGAFIDFGSRNSIISNCVFIDSNYGLFITTISGSIIKNNIFINLSKGITNPDNSPLGGPNNLIIINNSFFNLRNEGISLSFLSTSPTYYQYINMTKNFFKNNKNGIRLKNAAYYAHICDNRIIESNYTSSYGINILTENNWLSYNISNNYLKPDLAREK